MKQPDIHLSTTPAQNSLRKSAVALCTLVFLSSCAASTYTSYTPTEIVIVSKDQTLRTAEASMEKQGLHVVEKNEGRGLIASKWQTQGNRQYNVQVLISPVGSVVKVGCRIQHNLDMQDCGSASEVPVVLVKHAKAIASEIEKAEGAPAFANSSNSFTIDP